MKLVDTVKHTALPWQTMNSHKPGCRDIVSLGDDQRQNRKWICEIPPSDTDDAAFICLAVNSHAALVSACEAARDYLESVMSEPVDQTLRATWFKTMSALALAHGTKEVQS